MRDPEVYELAEKLAIALPARSGREVAALLEFADKEPLTAKERVKSLGSSASNAVNRRARESLRSKLES